MNHRAGKLCLYLVIPAASLGLGRLSGALYKDEHQPSSTHQQQTEPELAGGQSTSTSQAIPGGELFIPKQFSDREVWRWKTYDALLDPEFSLTRGADWSQLRALLDEDLEGTLSALVDLDLATAPDIISLPLYLGQYFSEKSYTNTVSKLGILEKDDYLFSNVVDQLTVAVTDDPNRLPEIKDFFKENPKSTVVESAAHLLGARLYEMQGGIDAALEFGTSLPPGITRANYFEGALIPWIDGDRAKAESFLANIPDALPGELDGAYSKIAIAYGANGEFQEGLSVAENMPESQHRYDGLYSIFWDWYESDLVGLRNYVEENHQSLDPQTRNALGDIFEYHNETRDITPNEP